jgi:hypothetical protein
MQPHYLIVGIGRTWWAQSSMAENLLRSKYKSIACHIRLIYQEIRAFHRQFPNRRSGLASAQQDETCRSANKPPRNTSISACWPVSVIPESLGRFLTRGIMWTTGRGRMHRRELTFTAQIQGAPETIFDLVADMPHYGRWLPDSSAFGGTTDVAPYPVRLGTTYLDTGPIQKPGAVTEFTRPEHISFHHTVQIRQSLLNTNVDAGIRYSFKPTASGTDVERRLVLIFDLGAVSRLSLPLLLYGFRKENNRTLAALKRYVETGIQ